MTDARARPATGTGAKGARQPRLKAPAAETTPQAEPKSPRRRRAPTGKRATIVRRMWRTAEAQVRDIEERLLHDAQEPGERERDARMLAVLSRTLRELIAVDEAQRNSATPSDRSCRHDGFRDSETGDSMPRDMDEFRRSLSRKLEALVAEQQDPVSGEP